RFGAERGHAHDLGLTACEQARTMRAGEHADLDRYRADVLEAAAVRALAVLEDLGADEVLLQVVQNLGYGFGIGALFRELGENRVAQLTGRVFSAGLVCVGTEDRGLQLLAESLLNLLLEILVDRRRRGFLLRLAGELAQ